MALSIDSAVYSFEEQEELVDHENTYILKLRGRMAYRGNHSLVASLLRNQFGIINSQILEIYRNETPGVWFFRTTPEVTRQKNPHGTELDREGFEGSIYNVLREQTTTVLQWVPYQVNQRMLRNELEQILEKTFKLIKHKTHTDRWLLVHDMDERLPHYLNFQLLDKNGKLHSKPVLVAQSGRKPVCRHCGDEGHHSNECNAKRWTTVVKDTRVEEPKPGPSRPNTEKVKEKEGEKSPVKNQSPKKKPEKRNLEIEKTNESQETKSATPIIEDATSSDDEGWRTVRSKKTPIKTKNENRPTEVKRKRQMPETSEDEEKEKTKTQPKKIQIAKDVKSPKKTTTKKLESPESPEPQNEENSDYQEQSPIQVPFSPDYSMSGEFSSEIEEGECT